MSMISNIVKDLRDYSERSKGEISSLTCIAAATIEVLSEKARGQEWISCSECKRRCDKWDGLKTLQE